jgi:hypothetical protein
MYSLATGTKVEQAVWGLAMCLSGTTVPRCRTAVVAATDLVTVRGSAKLGSSSLTAVESGSSMGSVASLKTGK